MGGRGGGGEGGGGEAAPPPLDPRMKHIKRLLYTNDVVTFPMPVSLVSVGEKIGIPAWHLHL